MQKTLEFELGKQLPAQKMDLLYGLVGDDVLLAERDEIYQIANIAYKKGLNKEYKKAIEDIKAGRNVTKTESVDELLRLLRSRR